MTNVIHTVICFWTCTYHLKPFLISLVNLSASINNAWLLGSCFRAHKYSCVRISSIDKLLAAVNRKSTVIKILPWYCFMSVTQPICPLPPPRTPAPRASHLQKGFYWRKPASDRKGCGTVRTNTPTPSSLCTPALQTHSHCLSADLLVIVIRKATTQLHA